MAKLKDGADDPAPEAVLEYIEGVLDRLAQLAARHEHAALAATLRFAALEASRAEPVR